MTSVEQWVSPLPPVLELGRSAVRLFSLYRDFWNSGPSSSSLVAELRRSTCREMGEVFPIAPHLENSVERAANVLGAGVACCWLLGALRVSVGFYL